MKFIFRIIIIAFLSYVAELFFPWWSIVIVAFVVGFLMSGSSTNAFLGGILGVGLLWLVYATLISSQYPILPERVADLFNVGSSFVLAAVTALVGGIMGGLGALTGSYLRKLMYRKDRYVRY